MLETKRGVRSWVNTAQPVSVGKLDLNLAVHNRRLDARRGGLRHDLHRRNGQINAEAALPVEQEIVVKIVASRDGSHRRSALRRLRNNAVLEVVAPSTTRPPWLSRHRLVST